MKHCVLAKFAAEVTKAERQAMVPVVKDLFEHTTEIDGIHSVTLRTNCIDRENRFDIMIVIDMEPEALPAYDECSWHKQWKADYSKYLQAKAIFDYEE